MKKVVFVGASGLVGSFFCQAYENKYQIERVGRDNIKDVSNVFQQQVDTMIIAIHSSASKERYFTRKLFEESINILHTIIEKAVGVVSNIVFFSSGSIYRLNGYDLTVDSQLEFDSSNAYINSKLMAEALLRSFTTAFESITILRPFYIYGKNQKKSMLIPGLIDKILNEEMIVVGKGGGLKINPIHVSDVSNFLDYLIQSDFKGCRYYNLCGPQKVTLGEIINYIGRELNLSVNIKEDEREPVHCIGVSNFPQKAEVGVFAGLSEIL